MIAGIKLVQDISNCPRISDEDKIKALDDIIDMVKTDYTPNKFARNSPYELGIDGMFYWEDSKLGHDFWSKIYMAL